MFRKSLPVVLFIVMLTVALLPACSTSSQEK